MSTVAQKPLPTSRLWGEYEATIGYQGAGLLQIQADPERSEAWTVSCEGRRRTRLCNQ